MVLIFARMFYMILEQRLYRSELKIWILGVEKAPRLKDRKHPHISNIRVFAIF